MYNSGHLQWDGKRNSSYNHDSLSLLQRHLIALTVLCSTSIHQVTFLLYWFCFQRVISRLIAVVTGPSSQLVLASMRARSQLFEHQRLVFQYVELTWPAASILLLYSLSLLILFFAADTCTIVHLVPFNISLHS